jgi:hypothetical protein
VIQAIEEKIDAEMSKIAQEQGTGARSKQNE